MDDSNGSRSGAQTAVDLARLAKAIARIAKAAAASGIPGAAAAAVKETLPLLIKVLIAVVIIVVLIPLIIFTALPNLFFGFDSSDTEAIVDMTEKAMQVGGTYMSLEDFENGQIDAVVTSLAAEYANGGTAIDRIIVNSSFDEDDLMWFIAINSVAYQQDLDTMTTESIRQMSSSRLYYAPSLSITTGDNDSVSTTLYVTIGKLDPEDWMNELGFDEDAKTWAGALYETLFESGALDEFAPYYETFRPSYSGDTGFSGDVIYGGDYGNDIDISGFVDPSTKNNLDLAAYAIQAWENNWGYVWGTYGCVLTQSLFDYKLEQYPDGVGNYEDFIRDNWLGRRTADCIGLIKGYGWLDTSDMSINYGTNGMPDYGADSMYYAAVEAKAEHGSIDTMPEIPGLVLWKDGHAGVYIGNGYAIEAMGTKYGVVKTEVEGRGWAAWYKIPYINYTE